MESYRHQSSVWEDLPHMAGAAGNMIGTMIAGVVILTILVIFALKEIYRVFQRHGGENTKAGRYLTTSAVLFGLALAISGGLWIAERGTVAALIAAWSFLVFIVVIEWIDHQVASKDPRELWAGQSINSVLQRPWWNAQAA